MKIAIMQPYFFPYIGYFQLINAVDKFILYDDVNFIKQGWINRNRILLNGKPHFFTISLTEASSFKKINEINIKNESNKLLKMLSHAYRKCFNYNDIYLLVENILNFPEHNLSKFVNNSIINIAKYLAIDTEIVISSDNQISKELKGQERVISICKYYNADKYYNAIGGINIYNNDEFNMNGIEIRYIKTKDIIYKQFNNAYVPNLSIIDVIMFNTKEGINKMLNQYELI